MKKLRVLQSFRAIFIVLICMAHIDFQNWVTVFAAGGEGVAFFICLSGFLTGYIYKTRTIDSSFKGSVDFLVRKLKKFYPLHIIAIILTIPLEIHSIMINNGGDSILIKETLIKSALNALLLQVYVPFEGWYLNNINGAAWFLSCITFCYAFSLIGLKAIDYAKKKNKSVLLFLVVCITHCIIRLVFKNTSYHTFLLYVFPPFRYLEYFMAMIIGYNYNEKFVLIKNDHVINLLEIFVILFWVANHLSLYFGLSKVIGSYTVLIAFFIVYVFSKERGIISCILNNTFLIDVGDASFYVFILHQVVIRYTKRLLYMVGHGGAANMASVMSVAALIIIVTYLNKKSSAKKKDIKKYRGCIK